MKRIVVAGGCFWGVEEYYRRLKGIVNTRVGYAQGLIKNPSYQQVCTGQTQHVEVCELEYDESVISLQKVLEHLFRIVDPTSLNKQGHDVGSQYRVGVYYVDEKDLPIIQSYYEERAKDYAKALVMELEALREFYDAEDYHQKYLVKNPGGYCHVNMRLIRDDEKK